MAETAAKRKQPDTARAGWLLWPPAGAAVAAVAIPLLLWAGTGEPERLTRNRARLAAMTETERSQLAARARRFAALSSDEQNHLRQLRAELEQESRLRSTLNRYDDWLAELSPWQRDELMAASDSSTRRRLVEKYVAQQAQEAERGEPPASGQHLQRLQRAVKVMPAVSSSELEMLIDSMQSSLTLSSQERERLERLPLMEQAATVLQLMFAQRGGDAARWPTDEEARRLTEQLTTQPVRGRLQSIQGTQQTRFLLTRIAGAQVLRYFLAEREKNGPTTEQLAAKLEQLPADEADRLMQQPPAKQLQFLEQAAWEDASTPDALQPLLQLMRQIETGGRGGGPAFRPRDRTGSMKPKTRYGARPDRDEPPGASGRGPGARPGVDSRRRKRFREQ